jgi:hypothetical protein
MLIELPESTSAATLRELNSTGIYKNFEPFCLFKLHLSEKSKLLHVSSDTSLSDWSDNDDEKQLLFTLFTDFLSGACLRIMKYYNWNGRGNVYQNLHCQLCSQKGHTALQCCKINNHNSQNSRVVCQICSTFGHS